MNDNTPGTKLIDPNDIIDEQISQGDIMGEEMNTIFLDQENILADIQIMEDVEALDELLQGLF